MSDLSNKIALAIMMDIKSRSGLKDAFEAIAPSIRIELMDTWKSKIDAIISAEVKANVSAPTTTAKTTGVKK